jgi:hypothetical protein
VGELSLARPELPEGLRDGHGLDASAQQLIEDGRPRGDSDYILASFSLLVAGDESVVLELLGGLEDLVDLGLVDALDVAELLLGGHDDAGDGAESAGFELGDVCRVDAVLLQLFDLDEVGLLDVLHALLHLLLHLLLLVLRLLLLLHGVSSQN